MCILRTKIRYNLNLKIKISLQLSMLNASYQYSTCSKTCFFFIFVLFYIVNLGIALHTKQFTEETTKEKDSADSSVVNVSSITGKQLKDNSRKLEETTLKELIEKYKKQPRRNVLNPSFASPTSLPLYFYFGYQLLEESTQWQECGHVRS